MRAQYVDHMGSDLSVVNAARVSFAKQKDVMDENDEGLVRFLAKHDHWTPFAHTAITLRMSAPVPIRTQCFKHKQGLVENEESRRYISSTPELFVPESFRMKPEGSIKQGSGGIHPDSDMWLAAYRMQCEGAIALYERMVANGICPEQARFILPQGCEVNWIWTGNVYAFANFFNKRTDSHAQKEIQDLALQVGEVIASLYPVSWAALTGQEVSTNG